MPLMLTGAHVTRIDEDTGALNITQNNLEKNPTYLLYYLPFALQALLRSRGLATITEHARSGQSRVVKAEEPLGDDFSFREIRLTHSTMADHEIGSRRYGDEYGILHRGKRLHWVRGHIRNQWYPSVGRNQKKWVMGHFRGDKENGILGNENAVYVARG
jgi:hypothetical protein